MWLFECRRIDGVTCDEVVIVLKSVGLEGHLSKFPERSTTCRRLEDQGTSIATASRFGSKPPRTFTNT